MDDDDDDDDWDDDDDDDDWDDDDDDDDWDDDDDDDDWDDDDDEEEEEDEVDVSAWEEFVVAYERYPRDTREQLVRDFATIVGERQAVQLCLATKTPSRAVDRLDIALALAEAYAKRWYCDTTTMSALQKHIAELRATIEARWQQACTQTRGA